jgi:hypothetical protein
MSGDGDADSDPLVVSHDVDGDGDDGDDGPGFWARLKARLTSSRAKAFYVSVATFAVAIGALYLSYRAFGLIETIIYAFVFGFTATVVPISIMLMRAGTPFNAGIGRFHVVLGAFAFGHHYLVQLDDRWKWCPGDGARYWLDGEYHDIDAGFDNRSVLGWRPFGILRHKDYDTLADKRVDDGGAGDVSIADGGAVNRGGYDMLEEPPETGRREWLLDLRRVLTRGIKQIGDIDLIETAEEIIERGQVDESKMGSYRPLVAFVVMSIIGLIAGYVFLIA